MRKRSKQQPPKKEAKVYFALDELSGRVKIGSSVDPEKRIQTITGPSPIHILHVEGGGVESERSLHERFSHLRAYREWFHPSEEITDYIASAKPYDFEAEKLREDSLMMEHLRDVMPKLKSLQGAGQ